MHRGLDTRQEKKRLKGVSAMSSYAGTLEWLGGMFKCSRAVSGMFVLFIIK